MTKRIYFDTTIDTFANAPDMRVDGFARATLMGNWGLFATVNGVYDTSKIDMETVKAAFSYPEYWRGRLSDPVIIDEEYLDYHGGNRDAAHDQIIEVLRYYRYRLPGLAIGLYARLPEINFYGPLIKYSSIFGTNIDYYEDWQDHNGHFFSNTNEATRRKTKRGLASQVDRVYPSIYSPLEYLGDTWMKYWKIAFDSNIVESEQYHKPIYPYISPQYHSTGAFFSAGLWKEMLSHAMNHPSVDGVVVHLTVPHGTPWDDGADWWTETLAVKELR